MIHFDFIVSDMEAETIFDGIQSLIVRNLVLIQDEMVGANRKEFIGALEKHISYLEALKEKMKNSNANSSF